MSSIVRLTESLVSDTLTAQTFVSTNPNRIGVWIHNQSTEKLYLRYGSTASTTSSTHVVQPFAIWEMSPSDMFYGNISGVWGINGSGRAVVREYEAEGQDAIQAPFVIVDPDDTTAPLTEFFRVNENGSWWFGTDEGITFNNGDPEQGIDGGTTRNRAILVGKPHSTGQNPGRLYANGGMAMFVIDEIPEIVFRRSAGKFRDNDTAQSVGIAAEIVDVTALSGGTITLTTVPVSADVWGTNHYALIQRGSQQAIVSYTSFDLATKRLLGCTYLTTLPDGTDCTAIGSVNYPTTGTTTYVTRILEGGAGLMYLFGQPDQGRGGFQGKAAAITYSTTEFSRPDGHGAYHQGCQINFVTSNEGPRSVDLVRESITSDGGHLFVGSWAQDFSSWTSGRRLMVAPTQTNVLGLHTIPTPATTAFWIEVDDPSGFPSAGTLTVTTSAGAAPITYTSYGVGDGVTVAADGAVSSKGRWYFKGCQTTAPTFNGATIADNQKVDRAKIDLGTVAGFRGNAVFYDFAEDYRVEAGRVGPTASQPEGGVRLGIDNSGDWVLYRKSSNLAALESGDSLEFPAFASFAEVADPGAADANTARVFAVDDGAGNTALRVRFPSGNSQTLARQGAEPLIALPAQIWTSGSGSPALSTVGGGNVTAWLLDGAGATETIQASFVVPDFWQSMAVDVNWANAGAGSGDVRFRLASLQVAAGGDYSAAHSTGDTTATAGLQNIKVATTVGTITLSTARAGNLRLTRISGDAADTLTNDIGVVTIILRRVS